MFRRDMHSVDSGHIPGCDSGDLHQTKHRRFGGDGNDGYPCDSFFRCCVPYSHTHLLNCESIADDEPDFLAITNPDAHDHQHV